MSGIGPRTALGIMAEETAERIVRAIRGEDNGFLCRLPGLGKRTAERLVVELKDKLADLEMEPAETEPVAALRDDAILALTSLGMPAARRPARPRTDRLERTGDVESRSDHQGSAQTRGRAFEPLCEPRMSTREASGTTLVPEGSTT